MKIEPNPRECRLSSISTGDFVEVRMNAALNSGFNGYVRDTKADRLHIVVHEVFGIFESDPANDAARAKRGDCLAMSLVVPISSIAWIRHLPHRPVDCACEDGEG